MPFPSPLSNSKKIPLLPWLFVCCWLCLIFNKKIWSRDKAKSGNRIYTGSNPHNKHLHISINPNKSNDTSPWFWWLNQPNPLATLVASITPMPAKKAYTNPVCTAALILFSTSP